MKLLGAAIIISVCCYIGFSTAKSEADKAKTVDSVLNLLSYMKRRISAERTPVFDIFSSFSDEYLEKIGFLPILRSHRYISNDLWKEALSALALSEEVKNELMHFGAELGSLPLEEQLKRIKSCADFLDSERAFLREALPKKQKSIKAFWLLSGILAAIILF